MYVLQVHMRNLKFVSARTVRTKLLISVVWGTFGRSTVETPGIGTDLQRSDGLANESSLDRERRQPLFPERCQQIA